MTTIDVSLSSEYGIMFLYDSRIKPEFPSESGKSPVTYTSSCLAFSVLIYVDGDANISLRQEPSDMCDKEYFKGEIECPSGSVSLYDHNGFAFASVPLKSKTAQVSLRMSEERNPDRVECVIENVEAF